MTQDKGPGLPATYVGLWADRDNRSYFVTSGTTIEYIDGDQWGQIAGIYTAPNNDLVANWSQSKHLALDSSRRIDTSGLIRSGWGAAKWLDSQDDAYDVREAFVLGVGVPDNVRYTGEFRAKYLSNSVISFAMTDSKGISHLRSSLFYLGEYANAMVDGVFKDKYTELSITEKWSKKKYAVEGSFSHNGRTYNVRGERAFTRGILTVIDRSTGNRAGTVIYGYNPTPEQVAKFKSSFDPTDRVLVNFVVPGVPTTQIKQLGRNSSSES